MSDSCGRTTMKERRNVRAVCDESRLIIRFRFPEPFLKGGVPVSDDRRYRVRQRHGCVSATLARGRRRRRRRSVSRTIIFAAAPTGAPTRAQQRTDSAVPGRFVVGCRGFARVRLRRDLAHGRGNLVEFFSVFPLFLSPPSAANGSR